MDSLKLQAVLWLTISFLLGYDFTTEGVMMVSPSEIAPACNGEKLKVTCTTTGDFLQWNVTLVEGETILMPSYTRIISSDGTNSERKPVITNSTLISFLRTSVERASPLISMLIINPVSRILNGSRVECIELPRETSESSFTVVHVMDFDYNYPEVNISSVSELFESNHVTVTIKWTSENPVQLVSYNVSVIPQGTIKFNGSAMAQLTLSYNTLYNVSILAGVPCGLNTTTFIVVNYVKCRYPQVRNNAISIMGHGKDPLIEGTTVHFTCPYGLEQIGPNTSTCMDNGVWVPDTMDMECRGQSTTTMSCQPDGDVTMNNTCPKSFGAHSPINLILWSSIGGVMALVCVIFIFLVMFILLMVKRKGLINKKFNRSCARSRDINSDTNPDNNYDEMNDHSQVVEAKRVVYADIGPSSLNLQFIHAIQDVDDYHVEYAQLNKDKLEESQLRVISESVKPPKNVNSFTVNLDDLLIQLRSEVSPHWYQFGQAIGIEKDILDDFAQKCSPEECIVETLDYWLRNHMGQPNWREIAEALVAINLIHLAQHIVETLYLIGNPPIIGGNNVEPARSMPAVLPPPIPPKKKNLITEAVILNPSEISLSYNSPSTSSPVPLLPPKPINTMSEGSSVMIDVQVPPARPPKPPKPPE